MCNRSRRLAGGIMLLTFNYVVTVLKVPYRRNS
jgi:hypothetical protein